ncbi:MAG: hypothetical protein CM1200mP40_25400 [Gammaproteobacteria bacterium]|nr:MAG: hypothetical protein CM1200mP40_25400 [Gammaproteobacteria bacterium]
MVINKPAGCLFMVARRRLGLIDALRQMDEGWRHLELVHRLDRDTSGCLVMQKN